MFSIMQPMFSLSNKTIPLTHTDLLLSKKLPALSHVNCRKNKSLLSCIWLSYENMQVFHFFLCKFMLVLVHNLKSRSLLELDCVRISCLFHLLVYGKINKRPCKSVTTAAIYCVPIAQCLLVACIEVLAGCLLI